MYTYTTSSRTVQWMGSHQCQVAFLSLPTRPRRIHIIGFPPWQTTWIPRHLCEFWIGNSRNSREFREFRLMGYSEFTIRNLRQAYEFCEYCAWWVYIPQAYIKIDVHLFRYFLSLLRTPHFVTKHLKTLLLTSTPCSSLLKCGVPGNTWIGVCPFLM